MSEKQQHPLNTVLVAVFGLLVAYLIFFGLIILDEMVFRTFYFSTYVPLGPEGQEMIRKIYWPLLKLLQFI